jgi:ABC-2 type transport system ATP-binding protein
VNAIDVSNLSYAYGRVAALRDVTFSVPDGALYALLGPNGSGKTTLLQILMGLRPAQNGTVVMGGVPSRALTMRDRARIGYVAEGQRLPGWMRLEQLEAYLAPLYDTWDKHLANMLRDRFDLDPTRKLRALSRGEQMKAAVLCALAPRPRVLIMDEPFTGMDALVKDELARGLLESAGDQGWSVLLCSHDIGELETLADWVGFLDRGTMRLSEPMDQLRDRFMRVDATLPDGAARFESLPADWMNVERAGTRLAFVVARREDNFIQRTILPRLGAGARIDVRPATLRETFVALARHSIDTRLAEIAA